MKPNRAANTSNFLKTVLAGLALIVSVHLASAQTIPASLAAPPGSVNTNILGMKMHIIQGNSGLTMTAAAPAERLISGKAIDAATGLPFENLATPNPVDGSFFYNIDRYINMHEQIPSNPDAAGGNFEGAAAGQGRDGGGGRAGLHGWGLPCWFERTGHPRHSVELYSITTECSAETMAGA